MNIRPILSSLRRHKTAATLIVLEIALSCAIICNAVFLIADRIERMQRPTGVAEKELVQLMLSRIGNSKDVDLYAAAREDLAALRAVPGVKSVAVASQVPLGGWSNNGGIRLKPEQTQSSANVAVYVGSEDLLETFGVKLLAGRDFLADEYVREDLARENNAFPPSVILTQALAQRLFPGKSGIGETIYVFDDAPMRVVGVIERLRRPRWVPEPGLEELSIMLPILTTNGNYVVRTDEARRAEIIIAGEAALKRVNPRRIFMEKQKTLEEIHNDAFQSDRAMAWLLVAVIIALLVVTALGIVGLASFWVQQRTKQIGVRRALGATRGQILRYFQTENLLLATIGIVIGMLLAYGINQVLMSKYELPRLPLMYLPIGAIVLWLLGQVSVFGPARRAAAVPPAIATRSV